MITLFELLIAVFMEKQTKKDPRNSSLPSSQTDPDETSTRPGPKGKGKRQNDALSGNTRTRETIQVAKVASCEGCGEDLHDIPANGQERRTKIDIIFEKVVSHVDAEIKVCPRCDTHLSLIHISEPTRL